MQVQVINVEAGVLKALKAYKIEKGMPDADAASWADVHLNEGVILVNDVLAKNRQHPEGGVDEAFAALKKWAQS